MGSSTTDGWRVDTVVDYGFGEHALTLVRGDGLEVTALVLVAWWRRAAHEPYEAALTVLSCTDESAREWLYAHADDVADDVGKSA